MGSYPKRNTSNYMAIQVVENLHKAVKKVMFYYSYTVLLSLLINEETSQQIPYHYLLFSLITCLACHII